MKKNNTLIEWALLTRAQQAVALHKTRKPTYSFRGQDVELPSVEDTSYCAYKKDVPVYTGTKMLGIGTMHKSNAVPIFSEDSAKDISTMRR